MIIRTVVLAAALSLATLPAVAQTGGQTGTAPAQDGASSSSSSSSDDGSMDELDQMIQDLATEAIQCVAVFDVETPAHPDKAADMAKMRAVAIDDFKTYTDYTDDDIAGLLPDLTQSYKDEVAKGNVKPDEWIDSCMADFKPEDAPAA